MLDRSEVGLDSVGTREEHDLIHAGRVGDELRREGRWKGELTEGSRRASGPLGEVEGLNLVVEPARSGLAGDEGHHRLVLVEREQRGRLFGGSKLSKLVLGHALLLLGRLAGLVLPTRVGHRVLVLSLRGLAMVQVFDVLALVLPLLANDDSYIKLAKARQI